MKILIAILTGLERHFWIHPDLFHACLRMPGYLDKPQTMQFTNVHGQVPVDAARNVAVTRLLASGAEWLLQIDNDTVPPEDILKILREVGDRKVIGFPCAGLQFGQDNLTLCLGHRHGDAYGMPTRLNATGWIEVDAVGAGCFLVHRDVFLALGDPWFECSREAELKLRTYAGEDFGFCEKARAAGFSIWTHSSYCCRHYRTVDLLQTMLQQVPLKPSDQTRINGEKGQKPCR